VARTVRSYLSNFSSTPVEADIMESRGQIVTFYSYKGGAGRSMALANISWILASNGHRVLTIDWDLEAPGLPRFFQPFLDDHVLASTPGLIDFFADYVESVSGLKQAVPSIDGYLTQDGQTDILRHVLSLNWKFPNDGRLDFLSAGKPGPAYARRVAQFNWEQLYARLDGRELVEALKGQFRSNYDYVLIDSRTGISDISGICTVQIPDILVVCFTLNRQSIEGSARVAESVDAQRRLGLRIFPIPMRVEHAELEKLNLVRKLIASKFTRFLGHLNDAG
jgi:cellulose biosynthesis protein BcsQ